MVIGNYKGKGDQDYWISCTDTMSALHIQFCDFVV